MLMVFAKREAKPIFAFLKVPTDAALYQGVLIHAPKPYQMPPTVKLLVFAPLGHPSEIDVVCWLAFDLNQRLKKATRSK
jgi:hypothetical protein